MISLLILIISAFLIPGLIANTKAVLSGRKLRPLFQPFYEIIKLLRKGSVFGETTSFIFQIAPTVYFASILIAIILVPFGSRGGLISFPSDFILFAYTLALGKFFLIIGAMDTGSGFEGMGANREAFYSFLIEPVFFGVVGSLALIADQPSFGALYSQLNAFNWSDPSIRWILAGCASYLLFQLALVENSRVPVDDPKTHLELTMIHEVMVLDNSGYDFGIIHIANHLKIALYGALIAGFFLIPSLPLLANCAIYLGVQIIYALAIGTIESLTVRHKMARNPLYMLLYSSLAVMFFGVVLMFVQPV